MKTIPLFAFSTLDNLQMSLKKGAASKIRIDGVVFIFNQKL